ncbi:hypothetical protein HK101_006539, partial [Irineochytrium annulatum]
YITSLETIVDLHRLHAEEDEKAAALASDLALLQAEFAALQGAYARSRGRQQPQPAAPPHDYATAAAVVPSVSGDRSSAELGTEGPANAAEGSTSPVRDGRASDVA